MAAVLLALCVTLIATPVAVRVLRRREVLDHPTARSSHEVPTPRGGGIGPALGLGTALTVIQLPTAPRVALIIAVVGFAVLGVVEDLRGIPPLPRFVAQLLIAGCVTRLLLEDLSGGVAWSIAASAAVVFWVVAYVNAFNFMDGINGISAAQCTIAGLCWFAAGHLSDVAAVSSVSLVVAGAAVAFAPYNFPRARVFLGDVGSYSLGGALATIAVIGVRCGIPPEAMAAPLILYGFDTATTLVRRARRKEIWYEPHRDHAYQRLVQAGWSHTRTTITVAAFVGAAGASGLMSSVVDGLAARVVAVLGVATMTAFYLALPRLATRTTAVT